MRPPLDHSANRAMLQRFVAGELDADAAHAELVRATWSRDDLDFLERRALLLFAEGFRTADEIRSELQALVEDPEVGLPLSGTGSVNIRASRVAESQNVRGRDITAPRSA